ncbi:hypothetical protein BCV70DRAFT_14245 [Testicularia cyperi]|uniref:Uncharacterized protein n=1 Tax=Testicularia cyperi TaxID=1882483 RepID=A0A317XZP0_9BASI|nr:hypothetical protein BCV70DRAFT_14245 [Testicularia cyperi]
MYGSPDDTSSFGSTAPPRNSLVEYSDSDFSFDNRRLQWLLHQKKRNKASAPQLATLGAQMVTDISTTQSSLNQHCNEIGRKPGRLKGLGSKLLVAARSRIPFAERNKKHAEASDPVEPWRSGMSKVPFRMLGDDFVVDPKKISLTPAIPESGSQRQDVEEDALTEIRSRLQSPDDDWIHPICRKPPPLPSAIHQNGSQAWPSVANKTVSFLQALPSDSPRCRPKVPTHLYDRPLPPIRVHRPLPIYPQDRQLLSSVKGERIADTSIEHYNASKDPTSSQLSGFDKGTKEPSQFRQEKDTSRQKSLRLAFDAARLADELESLISTQNDVRAKQASSSALSHASRSVYAKGRDMPGEMQESKWSFETTLLPEAKKAEHFESTPANEVHEPSRACEPAEANDVPPASEADSADRSHGKSRRRRRSRIAKVWEGKSAVTELEEIQAIERIKTWRVRIESAPSQLSSMAASAHSHYEESYSGVSTNLTSVSRSPLKAKVVGADTNEVTPKALKPQRVNVLPHSAGAVISAAARSDLACSIATGKSNDVDTVAMTGGISHERLSDGVRSTVKPASPVTGGAKHVHRITNSQFDRICGASVQASKHKSGDKEEICALQHAMITVQTKMLDNSDECRNLDDRLCKVSESQQ